MIDRTSDPVAWARLVHDLEDAREHLSDLLLRITDHALYGEPELRVDLGHVYAHLNRAWNLRNVPDAASRGFGPDEWDAWSRFPTDLAPV